ncbi:MAG: C-GCAxxG-C-C family protein [Thermodesulfobacteriota bacterium]|nr:C-GCAxxG-C-C family protein [Thermodesulfobacteriota bacterium]
MKDDKDAILEKAYNAALNYEKKCTGCAQTCIAGIFDALSIENDDVFKSASGLADGLGLTGDGTCGALVGGAMVIGYLFGREKKDFPDMLKPMKSYITAKKLHDRFCEKYGSCRCYDIQKHLMGRTFNLYDPNGLKEATDFGMMDHCSKVVGTAAMLAAEIILDEMERKKEKK